MPIQEYAGTAVELTDDGFLIDSSQWTRDIAREIAAETGVGELTDRHWEVIDFCRRDATEQGASPGLRRITQQSGVTMKELYQLFPKGPGKLAARVAGLPKPKGCI